MQWFKISHLENISFNSLWEAHIMPTEFLLFSVHLFILYNLFLFLCHSTSLYKVKDTPIIAVGSIEKWNIVQVLLCLASKFNYFSSFFPVVEPIFLLSLFSAFFISWRISDLQSSSVYMKTTTKRKRLSFSCVISRLLWRGGGCLAAGDGYHCAA